MTTESNNKVIGMFGFSAENLDIFRELFNASVEINLLNCHAKTPKTL